MLKAYQKYPTAKSKKHLRKVSYFDQNHKSSPSSQWEKIFITAKKEI